MGSEVTSIFITGCFWYWTVCKITVTVSPLREESRWHQRLANLAFAALVSIQLTALFFEAIAASWVVSVFSSITVVFILVLSKFDREGFWSKTRNQIVGSVFLLGSGFLMPILVQSTHITALFYAVILAHEFHRAQIKQFLAIHQDLDSMRSKVSKLEAALRNSRIEKESILPPKSRSTVYAAPAHGSPAQKQIKI